MKFHLKCTQAHQEGKYLSTEQQKRAVLWVKNLFTMKLKNNSPTTEDKCGAIIIMTHNRKCVWQSSKWVAHSHLVCQQVLLFMHMHAHAHTHRDNKMSQMWITDLETASSALLKLMCCTIKLFGAAETWTRLCSHAVDYRMLHICYWNNPYMKKKLSFSIDQASATFPIPQSPHLFLFNYPFASPDASSLSPKCVTDKRKSQLRVIHCWFDS